MSVRVFNGQESLNAFIKDKKIFGMSIENRNTLGTSYLMTNDGEGEVFVRIETEGRAPDDITGTVVHEMSHATDFIFQHLGEHSPGTETRAYLMDHLVTEAIKWLKN